MPPYRKGLPPGTVGRDDLARELDDEIRAHVEMRVEELVAAGATPEEAREEALRRFGDPGRAHRRLYRTARRSRVRLRARQRLEQTGRDLMLSVRQARRSPGFSLAAVLIVAVGVGLTTSTFSLVDHVLLRALPFPEADRLVSLQSVPASGEPFDQTSMANWVDWKEENTTLAGTAIYAAIDWPASVDVGDDVVRVPARTVSGPFFETLRPSFVLGRPFTEAEAQEEAPVVVVSEGFWRRMLGGDPMATERPLRVNARTVRVVGVLQAGQELPGGAEMWLPLPHRPGSGGMRNNVNWSAIGRLAGDATAAAAQADLTAIARGIMAQDPEGVYSHGVAVKPLRDVIVGDARSRLSLLMGAALFVLFVACANLAGLSLTRAARRAQEVAVRLAMGAGRSGVLRQVVTEHLVLALAGGLLGILGALVVTGWVTGALESTLPRAAEVAFDGRIAAFGMVAALSSGLLAGVLPALRASSAAPGAVLSGSRGTVSGGGGLQGAVLVAAEVALAVLLVTGVALLARSFRTLIDRDLGYDPAGVITAEIRLVSPEYSDGQRASAYWSTLLDEVAGTPGVEAVGMANWIPTGDAGSGWIDLADQPDREAGAAYRIVSEGYFDALGIPLLEGRGFDDRDAPGAARTVVVNERMARTYWPGVSPLGRRIRARSMEEWYHRNAGLEPWLTVVGVVGDVRHYGWEDAPESEMYVLYRQIPQRLRGMTVVARASVADPGTVMRAVRTRARAVDPTLAVEVDTLDRRLSGLMAVRRLFMSVLGAFASLALLLACLGVYGLLSFAVSERTREFAVRTALGAERHRIVLLTLGRAAPILAGGVAAGLAATLWLSGFLEAQLVEVAPTDPLAYLGSAALLLAVAAAAALVPALRAARTDPLEALKEV